MKAYSGLSQEMKEKGQGDPEGQFFLSAVPYGVKYTGQLFFQALSHRWPWQSRAVC